MTSADFVAFYPQFTEFSPGVVMDTYIQQANGRFGDFGEDAEEARRLYVAHKLTLYDFTALPAEERGSSSSRASAGKGLSVTEVSSKKVGEVQVNYSHTSLSSSGGSVSTSLADLTETVYGLQLLTLLRMHGFTRYMP